jgi:hypothetical protein
MVFMTNSFYLADIQGSTNRAASLEEKILPLPLSENFTGFRNCMPETRDKDQKVFKSHTHTHTNTHTLT